MPDFITTQDILESINNKPKLPMQTLGMPGPAHVMGLAKNIAQGVPPYLSDIYERMKRAVTQGPYSSPSGSYDPSIGTLPFEIMSPGYGRAAAGAIGAQGGKLFRAQALTANQKAVLKELYTQGNTSAPKLAQHIQANYGDQEITPYLIRRTLKDMGLVQERKPLTPPPPTPPLKDNIPDISMGQKGEPKYGMPSNESYSFRDVLRHPAMQKVIGDLHQSGMNADQIASHLRNTWDYPELNGKNIQTVINNLPKTGGGSFELGAFGGQGRLNTPSYGESMGWLQDQKPVDRQWVENWAKDAGVPIKDINVTKRKGQESTTYVKMLDNSGKQVTVRIPNDPLGHIGYPQKGKEGSFFDTGREVVKYPTLEPMDKISPNKQLFSREGNTGGVLAPNYTPYESNLVNEAGMPYANKEALDAALKWRLSKAPFGGNWLVSEDMAPRLPPKIAPQPNISNAPDPRQLQLLSQGFTPADILKVLQQNGQQPQ